MIITDENSRTWEETVFAYFIFLFKQFPEEAEENHGSPE
jgi:hypothetical protein